MERPEDLAAFLARSYGAGGVAVRPLARSTDKALYLIERGARPPWLLRVGPIGGDPTAFRADATVLLALEGRTYPAPRVVPGRDGAVVASWATRPVLVTSFVVGEPLGDDPATLGRLVERLGQLHALSFAAEEVGGASPLPPARMVPRTELAAASAWLTEVRDRVPGQALRRYERLVAACHTLDHLEDLPRALIHNDCHPGNAVRTADGGVTLIDWEGAGRGAPAIDVGFLLVSCEIAAFGPSRNLADPARLAAIVAGYCRHHRLTARELAPLADAIAFRAVVACAFAFRRMILDGREADAAGWAWARLDAAERLAARAQESFARQG